MVARHIIAIKGLPHGCNLGEVCRNLNVDAKPEDVVLDCILGDDGTTLRHLATVEIYKSLQYQWIFDQNTICKFITIVFRDNLAELQKEYLACPATLEDWKKIKEKIRTR